MMKTIPVLLALVCIFSLCSCSTTTEISSIPTGATVTLDDSYAGITPFKINVTTKFGIYNKYIFKAQKDGFQPKMLILQEKTFGGAASAVPPEIKFELEPAPAAVPATGADKASKP